jgi:hypothetical protein
LWMLQFGPAVDMTVRQLHGSGESMRIPWNKKDPRPEAEFLRLLARNWHKLLPKAEVYKNLNDMFSLTNDVQFVGRK